MMSATSVVAAHPASAEDVADLQTVFEASQTEAGASPEWLAHVRSEGRLRSLLERDDVTALVARVHGRPVGYALVLTCPVSVLLDLPAMRVEQLYVVPSARSRGVAQSLLAGVARLAERSGTERIMSECASQGRELHRFYVRMGFLPFSSTRITSRGALVRRLQRDSGQRAVRQLLARRRLLRERFGSLAIVPDLPDLEGDAARAADQRELPAASAVARPSAAG